MDITEQEAFEILQALVLKAHQYRVKGTIHGENVQLLHEKLRLQFKEEFGWQADAHTLLMTDVVVGIRSTAIRGM